MAAAVVAVAIGYFAASPLWETPPPDPMLIEPPAIEAAMGAYRTAYRNRDVESVTKVFPTLPAATRRAMEQAFANCLVYEVVFDEMQVMFDGTDPTHARADVQSTHTCTPNEGRQTMSRRHELFSLTKTDGTWLIERAVPASGQSQ